MSQDQAPNHSPQEENNIHNQESWYKWGVVVLYTEMGIAILVTLYSLYMAFTGSGGFPGH